MPSATNLISFPRSVESHRSGEPQLKFAWEVLWRPILNLEKTTTGPDLNRLRWVQDHLNECWFALLVRRRVLWLYDLVIYTTSSFGVSEASAPDKGFETDPEVV
jgi:hypothetical protein